MELTDWMTGIDGRRTLAELTIPGTHDSGARRGGPRLRTQTLDLGAQLAAGIRFLDIRLRLQGGALRVYHGEADQRCEFVGGVLAPVAGFLAEHPGEAVVMSVKQEDDRDPPGFAPAVDRAVAGLHVAPGFPALDDVRGKLVLLRRYAGGSLGIPAPPDRWIDDATFAIATPGGTLQIEDEWRVVRPLDAKWSAVAAHLDAAADAAPDDWFITFASGTGRYVYPRQVARVINARLRDHAARGTVVMDFPDGELVRRLVEVNRPA